LPRPGSIISVGSGFGRPAAQPYSNFPKGISHTGGFQPRPQGLLAFQNGGGSGEDPGTQQITCLQRGWRRIQNGGYGEKGEKNWVRDAKVKIRKMAEKAEVQFKKK